MKMSGVLVEKSSELEGEFLFVLLGSRIDL